MRSGSNGRAKMTSKKVLIICGQEIILERNDGGKQCSYRNYRLLQQVFGEENVCLCMLTNCGEQSEKNIIRFPAHRSFVNRMFNILRGNLFTSDKTENAIISLIKEGEFDIVFFERSLYGSIVDKMALQELFCEIWVFIHNIERNYFLNKIKHQSFLYMLPYFKIANSERKTIYRADYIITLTHRDSELLKEVYQKGSNLVLPMSFHDVFKEEKIRVEENKDKQEILFVGSMFPPNLDGIRWFINQVMVDLPECILKIVGKGFEYKRKELERENVIVIGSVENLEAYYYSNNIMVMPIFYGDGIKVKTAEAMMYGKTILASDEALEGYQTEGTEDIYRCNTKKDFLKAIKEISFRKQQGYSKNVRELFCSKYSLDNQIEECRKIWT